MPHLCFRCHASTVPVRRWAAGYRSCMPCGEEAARTELRRKASMVIPINKSTPTYISDPMLLRALNAKRTT